MFSSLAKRAMKNRFSSVIELLSERPVIVSPSGIAISVHDKIVVTKALPRPLPVGKSLVT